MTSLDGAPEPKKMCPYCGGAVFQNSWGRGNARCPECGREFVVVFENGEMMGLPIEECERVSPPPVRLDGGGLGA